MALVDTYRALHPQKAKYTIIFLDMTYQDIIQIPINLLTKIALKDYSVIKVEIIYKKNMGGVRGKVIGQSGVH